MARATRMAGISGKLGFLDFLKFNPAIVTPAGSNSQANSTLLDRAYSLITTLSGVTTRGVRAFVVASGDLLIVKNDQSVTVKVYPNTSAALGTASGAGTANSVYTLAAHKCAIWVARSRTQLDLVALLA